MPWESEHNRNSLSPHGNKEASGFAARSMHDTNCVPAPNMPPPLRGDAPMSMRPHDKGFRQPVNIAPSGARPANDMGPPIHPGGVLDANPHPSTPAAQKQSANTYRKVRR